MQQQNEAKTQLLESLNEYFSRHENENNVLKTIIEKMIENPSKAVVSEREAAVLRKNGVQKILHKVLKEIGFEYNTIVFTDDDANPYLQVT